jgi:insulysin
MAYREQRKGQLRHGNPVTNAEEEEESLLKRAGKQGRRSSGGRTSSVGSSVGVKPADKSWKLVISIFENISLMCWLVIGVLIFLCLIVLVLAEGRSRNNPSLTGVETAIAIKKGDTDPRTYQFSVLENGMQVLLVSDPNTDKAAAALDVRVGHFSDPEDTPGLSHLLEHMLFLGTKKFPDEDAFDKFLSSHGGMSNAYTSKEDTNYHFEVLPDALEKSLEMFSSFFIDPLLTPERIGRERKAVDSENEKNLQNDEWRLTQLLRSTSNPNHPYHKFGTGSRLTLKNQAPKRNGSRWTNGTTLHAQLVRHHREHYTAPRMRLVILGRSDVAELESLARQYFSEVPNRKGAKKTPTWNYPKLKVRTANGLGVRYDLRPVEDTRLLHLYWLLPPTEKNYRKKTIEYLSTILAGEGPGSIHAALHKEGLVTEISGGAEDGSSVHNFMAMKLFLTAKGLEKIDHIVTVVYAYINMIKREGPAMKYWLECKKMAEVDLRFVEKKNAANSVSDLAQNMQVTDPSDVLVSDNLWVDFDADDIKQMTNQLSPANMVMFVGARSLELGGNPKEEKWYGTKFTSRQLSYDNIVEWSKVSISSLKEQLAFPKPNEFIPSDFTIKSGLSPAEAAKAVSAKPTTHPHAIENVQSRYRIWFKQDDTYGVPKVNVLASLHLEHFGVDDTSMVHATIFAELVKDYLREKMYAATVAGISYNIETTAQGLQIQLIGYNQHMNMCVKDVADTIKYLAKGDVGSDFSGRLELLIDRYDKELKNWAEEQPYKHAKGYSAFMLKKPYFLPSGLLAVIGNRELVNAQSVLNFIKGALRGKCFLQTLFHGNVDEEDTKEMRRSMVELIKDCKPMDPESKRVRILPKGETVVRVQEPNQEEGNSAIINTYQLGTEGAWDDLEKTCQLKVMAALTGAAVYEQLRTREQLGYIVFSGPSKLGTVLEFVVIVQGTKQSPDVFNSRIEHFVTSEYKKLQALPQEKFAAFVASEVSRLKAPYKTLTDESSAYWSEIEEMSYMFGRPFKEIEQYKKVTIQEVTSMWGDKIANVQARQKLSVQVFSKHFQAPQPDNEKSMAMTHKPFKIAPGYPPLPQSEADELKMSVESGPTDFAGNADPGAHTPAANSNDTKPTASVHNALRGDKEASKKNSSAVHPVVARTKPQHDNSVHVELAKPVNDKGKKVVSGNATSGEPIVDRNVSSRRVDKEAEKELEFFRTRV